jgi:gluconolactonase
MTALYDIRQPQFGRLIFCNAPLQCLSTGHLWTEGPVWVPAHQCLYFSDIPNQKILRWTPDGAVTVLSEESDFSNGQTLDREGRMVTCRHGSRSVTRTEHDGRLITLVSEFEGKPLNSPNDVVVKRDGSVWFTDPTYGIMSNYEGWRSDPEQLARNVFRLDPQSGEIFSVCDSFVQPNGLAFSPDEETLYIAESGQSHDPDVPSVVRAFDVINGRELSLKGDFAHIKPGVPDGLRVDGQGNVWISSADSVQCFDPSGVLVGKIMIPEVVSNLAFGGPRNTHLFITATKSLYAINVNAESSVL